LVLLLQLLSGQEPDYVDARAALQSTRVHSMRVIARSEQACRHCHWPA
jgi:hypothetical protein